MITHTIELRGQHKCAVDIKAQSYNGHWGCIAFAPDLSIRCTRADVEISLRRFCVAVAAPYCADDKECSQISEDLFEEIQDILAEEDPRDHES
jgi:hypothetical protein